MYSVSLSFGFNSYWYSSNLFGSYLFRSGNKKQENNNVMSRYDHKIETSLEGIEHLSKEKKEEKERKMKEKNHYYNPLIL